MTARGALDLSDQSVFGSFSLPIIQFVQEVCFLRRLMLFNSRASPCSICYRGHFFRCFLFLLQGSDTQGPVCGAGVVFSLVRSDFRLNLIVQILKLTLLRATWLSSLRGHFLIVILHRHPEVRGLLFATANNFKVPTHIVIDVGRHWGHSAVHGGPAAWLVVQTTLCRRFRVWSDLVLIDAWFLRGPCQCRHSNIHIGVVIIHTFQVPLVNRQLGMDLCDPASFNMLLPCHLGWQMLLRVRRHSRRSRHRNFNRGWFLTSRWLLHEDKLCYLFFLN